VRPKNVITNERLRTTLELVEQINGSWGCAVNEVHASGTVTYITVMTDRSEVNDTHAWLQLVKVLGALEIGISGASLARLDRGNFAFVLEARRS
jgi:hypothetical protein